MADPVGSRYEGTIKGKGSEAPASPGQLLIEVHVINTESTTDTFYTAGHASGTYGTNMCKDIKYIVGAVVGYAEAPGADSYF